ncbi:MAG: SLOG family protein [Acidimicrobiia bacterium]|nr:SLOG family protein [Acidimicrobiia bacterium]MDH4306849.1 SLOG family protein [Acidimicrobiia bacterium]MDH5292849.1 SLOG family protein [Acidimicrobiia bacterium]
MVTGLRPPDLGGYEENPTSQAVRNRLRSILSAKHEMHPDAKVVTGMSLGAEMLAAEAAALEEIAYVAVLAHPDYDSAWPEATKRRFRHLIDGAAEVLTLDRSRPSDRRQLAASYGRRDAWLTKNADEAIVVWNGSDGPVDQTRRKLATAIGEENVWTLDPTELV